MRVVLHVNMRRCLWPPNAAKIVLFDASAVTVGLWCQAVLVRDRGYSTGSLNRTEFIAAGDGFGSFLPMEKNKTFDITSALTISTYKVHFLPIVKPRRPRHIFGVISRLVLFYIKIIVRNSPEETKTWYGFFCLSTELHCS